MWHKSNRIGEGLGNCEKCGMKQKLSHCKRNVVARALIEDKNKKKRSVTMFGDIVRLIESEVVSDDEDDGSDLGMKLLFAGVKEFQVNSQNTIVRVVNAE